MKNIKKAICIMLTAMVSFCILNGCGLWGDPSEKPSGATSAPTPFNPYKEQESELEMKISQLPLPEDADVFYVVASTGDGAQCRFYSFEKKDGRWMNVWDTDGYIGKNGIDPEREENSGRTPGGFYRMGEAFGLGKAPDKMNVDYHTITDDDYWDGDGNSDKYNQMVKASEMPAGWNKDAGEHLIDFTMPYQYCVNIEFNRNPAVPGKGFAIFLHCTGENEYTAGCVAIPKGYMIKVLKQLTSNSYIAIVDNLDELEALVY